MQNNPYRTEVEPIWCKGCGNYGVLDALTRRVFAKMGIPRHKISVVTGIGCSSRIAGYVNTYSSNGIHGRAIPHATGQKLASQILNKELHAVVIGGDGDMQAIGGLHLQHAADRGVNLTCLMIDNHGYAMTKGQTSPTTPFSGSGHGALTSGTFNPQLDPLRNMLSYMVSAGNGFLAQGLASNPEHLALLLEQAISYCGFAFISVQTPCITFNNKSWLRKLRDDKFAFYLQEGEPVELPDGRSWIHDPNNEDLAWALMKVPIDQRPYLGVIWRGPEKEDYTARVRRLFLENLQAKE